MVSLSVSLKNTAYIIMYRVYKASCRCWMRYVSHYSYCCIWPKWLLWDAEHELFEIAKFLVLSQYTLLCAPISAVSWHFAYVLQNSIAFLRATAILWYITVQARSSVCLSVCHTVYCVETTELGVISPTVSTRSQVLGTQFYLPFLMG